MRVKRRDIFVSTEGSSPEDTSEPSYSIHRLHIFIILIIFPLFYRRKLLFSVPAAPTLTMRGKIYLNFS